MTTASIDARSLPRPLRLGLERIDRKIRLLGLARGSGLALLAMALVAAAGMAADFFWPLPIAARWILWVGWIACGSALWIAFGIVPLFRRAAYGDLAAVAERGHPELGERIVGAVSLLGARDTPNGSPAMIAALGDEAARRASETDLSAAVSRRSAVGAAVLGLASLGMVAAPCLIKPDPFRMLAHRFLAPWADVSRVARFVVTVAPGDVIAAIGSDVNIQATVRPRFDRSVPPDSATLEWAGPDDEWHRTTMAADQENPAGSRGFRLRLPRIAGTIRYRVMAGSAEGIRHTITAVVPPSVAAISALVRPPSYTKRAESLAKNPARIEAWEGSKIDLRMTANKPIASARLEWPDAGASSSRATGSVSLVSRDGGTTWAATVPADVSGNYSFALVDEHKIASAAEIPRRLIVRPDKPPTIALAGSPDPQDAQGDDLLVVEIAARDDVAAITCDFLYKLERENTNDVPPEGETAVGLAGLGSRFARGEATLSLVSLGLHPGDEVAYRVRVADNRPAPKGPNVTISAPRALRIVAKAEPLLARERSIERRELRDRIEVLRKDVAENRQGTEALRNAADASNRGNGSWGEDRKADLGRREVEARAVADKLRGLARDLAESGRFAPLERAARQAADIEADGSRAMLDNARRAPDPARRLADLRAAGDRLATVQHRLDELKNRFDELARLDDDRLKLRQLAEAQDELARKAEEAGDPGGLDRLRPEQDQLRGQLDEIARRSPELKAEALASRAKEADDLARKTRDLAEKQREEARKTADPSGRDARLRGLVEAQRQLEDDARRLAMRVDRPLEENGRGRLDAGSLARAVEPLERGEIEQGRQRLEEAENALRRLGRDLEDVRDDPKSLARRLARRQDELGNHVSQRVREARDPDQKKALAEAFRPFAERENAIRKLAEALPVPENLREQLRETIRAVDRSGEDLKTNAYAHIQNHFNDARDRLHRLADALPDANQKRQEAMQSLREAKSRTDQVARELDQALRDTAPRPDRRDFDPDAAARELARRVGPLADRQAEAVRNLAEMRPERRADPHRDRALARARDLADALDAVRDASPPESRPEDAGAIVSWRVLGAFDDAEKFPPFAIDHPVDLNATFDGRERTRPSWNPVQAGGDGRVDLGSIYSRGNNLSAFAVAEVVSPSRGQGRLIVGSDDYLTIWIDGKRVYDFHGPRAWNRDQDRVDVTFAEGPNRLLVRCGNVSSDWAFSVAVRPPRLPEMARRDDHARRLRDALPALKVNATTALDRLEQKMNGQMPADDVASEIAAEMKNAPAISMPQAASALRNLKAPDASAHLVEAIRLAEKAERETTENAPTASETREAAALAATSLARRLNDALSPREQAAALADAQEGLAAPDATTDPRSQSEAQRAIADELAAIRSDALSKEVAAEVARRAADLADRRADHPDLAPSPAAIASAKADAAKAIRAFAQSPAELVAAPVDPPPGASPRAVARALADRQKDLADRVQGLREQTDAAPKGDKDVQGALAREMVAMGRDQQAIAAETRGLDDPLPANTPPRRDAEARRDEARSSQARASAALASNEPAVAVEKARAASEALDRLARSLPETDPGPDPSRAIAPADPELAISDAHAEEARALARRERRIRERLQAVMGERVAPQEELRQDAAALGREFADLRDGVRGLGDRSHGPANAAADLLGNQAPHVMNEGARHLAAGRRDQARDTQRRAAEVLERAAQQAEDLAAAIRSDSTAEALADAEARSRATEGPPNVPTPGLASARDAQSQAARQLAQPGGAESSKEISEAMRQAAKGLRAAASSSRGKPSPGPGGSPSSLASTNPRDGEAGRDAPHLAELKEEIRAKTGRAWGELPGHLRSEILQGSQGKYRDDYARLISLYFREIAAGRDDEGEP